MSDYLRGASAARVEKDVPVGVPLLSGMRVHSDSAAAQSINGVQFQVVGHDTQMVEVMVMPQQMVRCEPGAMVHMHSALATDIGTDGGCCQACTRCCCVGESFLRVKYTNKTSAPVAMAISPSWPAKMLPFDLSTYRRLNIQTGSFVGAVSGDIRFQVRLANSFGAACCGGQGVFFNEMSGDGVAFLAGGGACIEKTLGEKETIVLDTHSLLAWEPSVKMSVRQLEPNRRPRVSWSRTGGPVSAGAEPEAPSRLEPNRRPASAGAEPEAPPRLEPNWRPASAGAKSEGCISWSRTGGPPRLEPNRRAASAGPEPEGRLGWSQIGGLHRLEPPNLSQAFWRLLVYR